jgi:hypothetical protein
MSKPHMESNVCVFDYTLESFLGAIFKADAVCKEFVESVGVDETFKLGEFEFEKFDLLLECGYLCCVLKP